MADERAKFLSANLLRQITVMSLTASVGLMAVFAVDFINMIFISMLGKAELAAAIGYAVLDPILIFGLHLDLTGAAISTVCARVAIAGIALVPLIRVYGGFGKPTQASVSLDLSPVLAFAVPAVLTQLATPVGQAFVTRAMSDYGEQAVAGMAIISRMTPVAFGVIFALSGAVGPIIGQNIGAGQFDRVKGAFRDGLIFTAISR